MKIHHFVSVSSTNDEARELLANESVVFVTADYQQAGRGRNNKKWFGDKSENIYCSLGITFSDDMPSEKVSAYQGLGAVAAKLALTEATGENTEFYLKYPNDVYALCPDGKKRKISGVLTENGFIGNLCVYSIVGIGINVAQNYFPQELEENATSLKLLGYDLNTDIVINYLKKYTEDLLKINIDAMFSLWKEELSIEGKIISIAGSDERWVVEKMGEDGRLFVINPDNLEQRIIDNGDSIIYELG